MSVSISGDGAVTGIDQGLNVIGVLTATSFVGNLSGNVTGTVNSSGIATFTNGIVVSAGSTSAPSISPSGDSNTGIFFPSADTIAFGEGGVEALRINSSGNFGVGPGIGTTVIGDNIFVYNSNGWSTIGVKPASSTASAVNIYRPFGGVSTNNPEFFIGKKYTNSADGKLHFWRYDGTSHLTSDLEIDSSGRVTKPYQVYFYATTSGSQNTTSGIIPYTVANYNVGNHYNTTTSTFTAPVAGVYCISFQFFSLINAAGTADLIVNDVLTMRCGREGTESYYEGYSNSINKYLNVNDTVKVIWIAGTVHTNTPYSHFSAYLLG